MPDLIKLGSVEWGQLWRMVKKYGYAEVERAAGHVLRSQKLKDEKRHGLKSRR